MTVLSRSPCHRTLRQFSAKSSVMPSPNKNPERVVRRPAAEVVEEMAELARRDKARMWTPIPPAPRPPGRFWICQRPPLPPPINPIPPPSPERQQGVRVAAVSAHAHDEREAWLLKVAEEHARRPRTPSPRRRLLRPGKMEQAEMAVGHSEGVRAPLETPLVDRQV